jgi:serine/threonine protein kinase
VSDTSPQTCSTLIESIKANVLISKSGNAQVGDYGLSSIISNPTFTIAATPGVAGSSRWLAPEIIDPPGGAGSKPLTASKSADVFAFAMLAVEVFAGKVPFGDMKNESVVVQIVAGKRPEKPLAAEQLGLSVEMWKFIEKCWNQNPNKRPSMDQVVNTWEGFVTGYVVLLFNSPRS